MKDGRELLDIVLPRLACGAGRWVARGLALAFAGAVAAEEAAPDDGEAGCTPSQIEGASKLIPRGGGGEGESRTLHSFQSKLCSGERSSMKMILSGEYCATLHTQGFPGSFWQH